MANSAVVIVGRPNDDPLGPTGTVGVCAEKSRKLVVLVDAGDPWNGNELLERLGQLEMKDAVTHVVITHGHLDHCANMGLFSTATHIMDADIGMRRNGEACKYSVVPHWPYQISDNIEVMGDDPEPSSCGVLQSSCPICLLELRLRDKVSALNCGHIFHFGCINQWLAAKKQCPSCRKAVPRSGFIEKLFFNVVADSNTGLPQIDYVEETSRLSSALAAEKEKHKQLEENNKNLRITTKALEKKILKEKEKTEKEIPRLEAVVQNMKIMADEVPYLQREVVDLRNKLKATDFYTILTSYGRDAEKQLSDYLKKNGSLDTDKFFALLKAQNKELTDIRRQSRRTIENLTDERNDLQKTVQKKDAVINMLKNTVLGLRDRANVQTPMNKRLQKAIDAAPAKRYSMSFDDTYPIDDDVMKDFSTIQKENNTPTTSQNSVPKADDIDQLNFDSDEEYFTIPKTVEKKKIVQEKKKISVADESSDDFSFDIDVPTTIVNRIPIKKIPVVPRENLGLNSKGFINKPVYRPLNTPISSLIKPHLLKRKLGDDNKTTKNTLKPRVVKSARLSSYYERIQSTSRNSKNSDDDLITLE